MTADQPTPPRVELIPGAAVLEDLRDGALMDELAEQVREMNQLVLMHQKKATIVLRLTIEPVSNGSVVITDEVAVTPPKAALPRSIRFVDKAGNLRRNDTNRPQFPSIVGELDQAEREVRDV